MRVRNNKTRGTHDCKMHIHTPRGSRNFFSRGRLTPTDLLERFASILAMCSRMRSVVALAACYTRCSGFMGFNKVLYAGKEISVQSLGCTTAASSKQQD